MAGEANIWNPRTLLQLSADTKSIEEKLTATAGQTQFKLNDFTYVINTGALEVHKDGLLLTKNTDWAEQTLNSFSLVIPATAGAQIVASGHVAITGDVDVRDTDIFVSNYQAIRDYVGIEVTLYAQGQTVDGDKGEAWFQEITGMAPGFFVDDNSTVIVPTGGDGSIGWIQKEVGLSEVKTLTKAIEDTTAFSGKEVRISDRANALFSYETGQTPDEFVIVTCTGVPLLSLVLVDIGAMDARHVGAVLDDINNDAPAINAGLATGRIVVIPAGFTCHIAESLKPVSKQLLSAYGATIRTHEFSFPMIFIDGLTPVVELTVAGGFWDTDATTTSSFLQAEGDVGYGTNGLSSYIIKDLLISGMHTGFKLNNARTGTISNVRCACFRFMDYFGKTVELNIENSWFIATAERSIVDGYGIKCEATPADAYPEGLEVKSCLFFRFEKNLIIRDMLEFKSIGNFYDGSVAAGDQQIEIDFNTFIIGLSFTGDWISSAGVEFLTQSVPRELRVLFNACEFRNQPSHTVVQIRNFNAHIRIDGCHFDANTAGAVGVNCAQQNQFISMSDCTFEAFASLMQVKVFGKNCSISNCTHDIDVAVGNPVFFDEDSELIVTNVPMHSMFIRKVALPKATFVAGDIHDFGDVRLAKGDYAMNVRGRTGVATTSVSRIKAAITPTTTGVLDMADDVGVNSEFIELTGPQNLSVVHHFTVLETDKFNIALEWSSGTVEFDSDHGTISVVRI